MPNSAFFHAIPSLIFVRTIYRGVVNESIASPGIGVKVLNYQNVSEKINWLYQVQNR